MKKSLIYSLVFMLFISYTLPSYAQTNNEPLEQSTHKVNDDITINEKVYINEAVITATLENEELFAKSELIIDLDTNEIVLQNLLDDKTNNIVENQYDVYFLTIEGEDFRAFFIDKETGEEIYINSEKVQASVAPLVVVLATIARYSIARAIAKHGAARVTQALASNAARTKLPTDGLARQVANELGYRDTGYLSHRVAVFERAARDAVKGPRYIARDRTSHGGGVWKGANKIEDLASPTRRSGTYDAVLKRIRD
ncbi:SAR2788 family putative toxin [Lysinibacillus varians]|uniref:Novel toxin 21 domain-containing protein n=1 Tax=Lysinibacillus varians TaxID=1145276 RepID=A0ABY2T723_9BACI|nr:SAR2788 family putative toxin [Lysinibacillus varians]AHN24092.1 hypothetical protein T479_08840 [Lysinibacillus varians]TKI59884.1 hypothetical protein FC752_17235 [Lysinibacillus varians]